MRRSCFSGAKITVSCAIPVSEMIGAKCETGRDIAVADAKTVSDRKLKTLMCEAGNLSLCKCSSHAVGRRSTVQNRALARYTIFVVWKLYTCRFATQQTSVFEPHSAPSAFVH